MMGPQAHEKIIYYFFIANNLFAIFCDGIYFIFFWVKMKFSSKKKMKKKGSTDL